MLILPGLCSDILLGLDFQSQHQSVSFQHNGPKPPLTICGLSVLKVESPDLFFNLTSDVHPIATKSRRYCREDQEFIASEVRHLLNEGIIEPSNSPWRALVVVTQNENNKKRMVVDYSQTVNRFTLLDTYSLPCIDDTICAIALYRVYIDIDVASQRHITYNDSKSVYSTRKLAILGYIVEEGQIRPDPDRLRPFLDLPVPKDTKSLRRVLVFFSHYFQWIQRYSEKIRPLTQTSTFPISEEAKSAFVNLKRDVEQSVVCAVDEDSPFEVETDASDFAIAATLSQKGRPVSFFSRTLQRPEVNHASVEKEAKAIIEAVRHWRHYLTGRYFIIRTDQRSVAYMFDSKQRGKIKNEKIMRWRTELSCYSFDIVYRPRSENISADTLSRAYYATTYLPHSDLNQLHNSLCHPGVTCMYHFVKSRNLPYSLEDIRLANKTCKVCTETKPQFHSPAPAQLIKATQPFERLNMDFKGPLKSTNRNIYFLNIVDEYSRFPFVFPCKDVSTQSVIRCLCELFSLFGMPAYVHSDRGSCL